MSEVMVTMIAALAVELLLVLLVLLLVAWFRSRAARRRDHKAARVLVARVKNGQKEREAVIAGYLADRMGMSGESLEQAKATILRAELVLLQRFASLYKKRDAGAAAQFDIDLAAVVTPYHELQVDEIVVAADEPAADESEFEQLRAENARLSEELRVTMETMSRMLNEYSSMFAGGAGGMPASVAAMAGAPVTTATAAEAVSDAESQTGPVEPMPEAGSEEHADVAILADEVDAEEDLAAAEDAEAENAAGGETLAEVDGLDDVDDIADLSAEGEGHDEVPAEDPGGVDTDMTEQDAVDALLVAENDDSLLEEPEPDVAALPDEEPPEEVTVDVLEEIFGEAAAEFAPQDEVSAADAPLSSDEADIPDDAERAVDSAEGPSKDGEPPEIEIGVGDDLETVTELLEEDGAAEVVAFDEPEDLAGVDDFDVALAVDGDQLFDSAEHEVIATAEELEGDLLEVGEGQDAPDGAGLFDVVDETLKTGAGQ